MTHAEEKLQEFCRCLAVSIIQVYGGCVLHNDDTMTKIIDGVPVRKQSVGRKDWSHDWIKNVKPDDIDTRYFNLDYSRKN